jgi:hypothetical protein
MGNLEDLREEYELLGWRIILPEATTRHAANDLSTVKEKETHRKSDKWLQRENHRK